MPLNVMKVVFHNVRSRVSLLVSAIVHLDLLLLGGISFLLLKICLILGGFLLRELLLFGHLLLHLILFGGLVLSHGAHILGFLVDLLHVMAGGQHLVLAHSARSASSPLFTLPFAFLASSFVKGSVELDLGVFENVAQVLGDTVFGSQILLCEVHGLLVRQDRGRVGSEELLLNAHVVIGDGENSSSIL